MEVTKLSLLLKVLEGESAETLGSQLMLFRERALPDLVNNIKCGNALVGSDFYTGRQTVLFDEDELYRINAFDWDEEFGEVFETGGLVPLLEIRRTCHSREGRRVHWSLTCANTMGGSIRGRVGRRVTDSLFLGHIL